MMPGGPDQNAGLSCQAFDRCTRQEDPLVGKDVKRLAIAERAARNECQPFRIDHWQVRPVTGPDHRLQRPQPPVERVDARARDHVFDPLPPALGLDPCSRDKARGHTPASVANILYAVHTDCS